jgi:hypothetical protein
MSPLSRAIEWIIRNQFGRRNLTTFARAELALKLEPLIADKGKKNLKLSRGRGRKGCQVSDNLIDTKKEVAKAAGVSHETIRAAKFVQKHADEVHLKRFLQYWRNLFTSPLSRARCTTTAKSEAWVAADWSGLLKFGRPAISEQTV